MSVPLCERCNEPALVIYAQESLCGPCAVEALDENHHYLVVQVDDTVEKGSASNTKTSSLS